MHHPGHLNSTPCCNMSLSDHPGSPIQWPCRSSQTWSQALWMIMGQCHCQPRLHALTKANCGGISLCPQRHKPDPVHEGWTFSESNYWSRVGRIFVFLLILPQPRLSDTNCDRYHLPGCNYFHSSPHGQRGLRFADNIFECIFINGKLRITSHYLKQCLLRPLMHIFSTRRS